MANDSKMDMPLHIPWEERSIEGGCLVMIFLVALFGNVSLWIVILRTRDIRNESSYLLLCLSFADILVSVVGMPITIYTIFYGDWNFSDVTCTLIGFINMLTFVCSVMSLGMISFNRYIKICHNITYSRVYTPRNIISMVTGVWFISGALAFPPLVGWSSYSYAPTQSICFAEWKASVSYTLFMVGACFGGPCTAMTFCYIRILKTFRASGIRILNQSQTSETPSTVANTSMNPVNVSKLTANGSFLSVPDGDLLKLKEKRAKLKSKKAAKRRQEEYRLTFSLLIVIFVFIICWLPFCVTMFLSVFAPWTVHRNSDMFTILLGYANSGCNPFIYGFMNKRFNAAYRRLFRDMCFWREKREMSCDSSGGSPAPSAGDIRGSSSV